ncbi:MULTISPECIES: hypothetical protein [unclassified Polaribacter]|uniref:hypothetical protein n=1 Tax=unclassified Polaribacter TaxID=196858 RepID=UPI0011BF7FCB|nr:MULTISPECIES: hypothetical protein [unclassified Polaribacter]TXD50841.1 hypothetical protein ES043_14565 [Polaribacter sp. IC063]TXD57600.1 hypothetical protein ES044_14520 [Polaribacter sp. IC066]
MILITKNRAFLTSLILSCLLLFNTLKISFTYLYYHIDPVGFVEALCENKDKPELACNGKCHLKKVISSSSNSEKEPIQLIDLKKIILYNTMQTRYSVPLTKNNNSLPYKYLNDYQYLVVSSCFHPPQDSFL